MTATNQPIDLNPTHLETIQCILNEHVPDCEVRAFGSRAKWNARDYSDLDLAVVGQQPQSWRVLNQLETAFRESDLPFRVDVLDWHDISDKFREMIRNECISIKNAVESDWKSLKLGQCVTINDSTYSTKEAWPFINYLDTGNITENHIESIQHLVAGEDKIPSRARRKVQLGDIVYSMVRPVQKHFGLIRNLPNNFLVSTGFSTIRANPDIAHTEFIYYFLTQDHIIEHLQAIAENSTSAYPAIRPCDLEQLDIDLPPLQRQHDIAQILSVLDDKIELNRQMNETLEAMAQALFKSWFIDFDPVRAKMEGRWQPGESLPGLPAHLYDLFPDHLVVSSQLDKIPENWKLISLYEAMEINPVRSLRKGAIAPYLSMANMPTEGHIPPIITQKAYISGMKFTNGDTLMARITPCLENGKVSYVDFLQSGEIGWGSTEYIVMHPRHPIPNEFAYLLARDSQFISFAVQNMHGSSGRQRVSRDTISGYKLSLPNNPQTMQKFGELIRPMFSYISTNARELRTMISQRNYLLIKLLSSKLRFVDSKDQ